MYRWTALLVVVLTATLVAFGCSGTSTPVIPTGDQQITASTVVDSMGGNILWGYYDVYIDVENNTAESVPNRTGLFTANTVTFLNGNPAGITFPTLSTGTTATSITVSIDVSIAHPLTISVYDGEDVFGIFIPEGSNTLSSGLMFPATGTDASMSNEDGSTRWFNPTEFLVPGVLGYTPGILATPGYTASSEVNPYKYFSDGLAANGDAGAYIEAGGSGTFLNGTSNTRHYELDFPFTGGVNFNYAVTANWQGELPGDHPSHATEAVVTNATITDDLYFDGTVGGGNLKVSADIHGFGDLPSTVMIESNVGASGPGTVTGGGNTYSTYSWDLPGTPTSVDGNWYMILAEYSGSDYSNEFGVPNAASGDPLTAYFRADIFTSDIPYNAAPQISSGVDGEPLPGTTAVETYSVTATDPDGDPLSYNWNVTYQPSGNPVAGYQDVPGDGNGNLDVDFGAIGATNGDDFNIDCDVSDGIATTAATTLSVTTVCPTVVVSNCVPSTISVFGTYTITTNGSGFLTPNALLIDYTPPGYCPDWTPTVQNDVSDTVITWTCPPYYSRGCYYYNLYINLEVTNACGNSDKLNNAIWIGF